MGGDAANLLVLAFKWSTPILYGYWVTLQVAKGHDMVRALAIIFGLISPVMGIYALLQYLDPPDWDRLWMIRSKMDSIGEPYPYKVRVFRYTEFTGLVCYVRGDRHTADCLLHPTLVGCAVVRAASLGAGTIDGPHCLVVLRSGRSSLHLLHGNEKEGTCVGPVTWLRRACSHGRRICRPCASGAIQHTDLGSHRGWEYAIAAL